MGLTWGSGQLIAWIANARREAAMKRVLDEAPSSDAPEGATLVPTRA